ncbi:MAG: hypothetical protein RBT47_10020 [Anaerolineae bacterium]|jgi:hypothetical protein|nr:hypothetical protein [Anaerolineae bacterium]
MSIGLIVVIVLAVVMTIFFSLRDPNINPNAPQRKRKSRGNEDEQQDTGEHGTE